MKKVIGLVFVIAALVMSAGPALAGITRTSGSTVTFTDWSNWAIVAAVVVTLLGAALVARVVCHCMRWCRDGRDGDGRQPQAQPEESPILRAAREVEERERQLEAGRLKGRWAALEREVQMLGRSGQGHTALFRRVLKHKEKAKYAYLGFIGKVAVDKDEDSYPSDDWDDIQEQAIDSVSQLDHTPPGKPVEGPKGPTGDKGPRGDRGERGESGDKGERTGVQGRTTDADQQDDTVTLRHQEIDALTGKAQDAGMDEKEYLQFLRAVFGKKVGVGDRVPNAAKRAAFDRLNERLEQRRKADVRKPDGNGNGGAAPAAAQPAAGEPKAGKEEPKAAPKPKVVIPDKGKAKLAEPPKPEPEGDKPKGKVKTAKKGEGLVDEEAEIEEVVEEDGEGEKK